MMSPSQSRNVASLSATLVIKNRLEELVKLSQWINSLAKKADLSVKNTFQLDLILAESTTNIIQHAFDDNASHDIIIELAYQQDRFIINLIDDGRPFDPTQHPPVVFPRSLEESGEGGLGIHLIRNYVDEFHYQRQNNRNILTLVYHTNTP